jgi:hypothetical protein
MIPGPYYNTGPFGSIIQTLSIIFCIMKKIIGPVDLDELPDICAHGYFKMAKIRSNAKMQFQEKISLSVL